MAEPVIVMNSNDTIVAYIEKQGCMVSCAVCRTLTQEMLDWTGHYMMLLTARYIPGDKNTLMDQLSLLNLVHHTKWPLLPLVFSAICKEYSRPHIDLCVTRVNTKLPSYMSLIPELMVRKKDAFQHSWNDLNVYASLPFTLLRQVLSRVMPPWNLSKILVSPLCLQKKGFTDILSLLVEESLRLPMPRNLLVQPHEECFTGLELLHLHAWKLSREWSLTLGNCQVNCP